MAEWKGKFHEIDRPGQEAEIDELLTELFKRVGTLNVLTTKGDIITYDGTNVARLAAGSDGQVLTSRQSATTGLAWEDRASSGGGTSGGDRTYWLAGMAYGAL
jgi:hypothetical protein